MDRSEAFLLAVWLDADVAAEAIVKPHRKRRRSKTPPYGTHWPALRQSIINRDGRRCVLCHSRSSLEVHHITSKRSGGKDIRTNLVTLCDICHASADPGRRAYLPAHKRAGVQPFRSREWRAVLRERVEQAERRTAL